MNRTAQNPEEAVRNAELASRSRDALTGSLYVLRRSFREYDRFETAAGEEKAFEKLILQETSERLIPDRLGKEGLGHMKNESRAADAEHAESGSRACRHRKGKMEEGEKLTRLWAKGSY